jgi:prevent-host-death family protein
MPRAVSLSPKELSTSSNRVNVHDAKTHLSRLLERVAAGEEVVICKAGKPVAKLVPIKEQATPRTLGSMKGLIHLRDDFDDPLPPEILRYFIDPPD